MNFILKNKSGKSAAVVIIILLMILIIAAAAPWYFIISRNLDPDFVVVPPSAQPERPRDDDNISTDDEPEPEPTPTPEPTPQPLPRFDTIIDIHTENPDIARELSDIASGYSAVGASLTMYDGESGEYITYQYGLADVEERIDVDINTKFRVASLSKLTTVICAMVLADQGMIDLDTDISVYLGYEVINTGFPGTAITVRMLMQHKSSIFDSGAFDASRRRNSSESVRFLLERGGSFRKSEPGTHYEYTNFGYAVLGAICENVSGRTLDTYARDVLFKPLDIDAAYLPSKLSDTENIAVLYNENHSIVLSVEAQLAVEESDILGHDLHLAQGNLTISTLDYAKILTMLGNGGILKDTRILSEEAVHEINDANVEGIGYKQGLATRFSVGDFIRNEGFFWHTGSGYGMYSQYVYTALEGVNRGVVVALTGASIERDETGMVTVCSDLSRLVWENFTSLSRAHRTQETPAENTDNGDENGDE